MKAGSSKPMPTGPATASHPPARREDGVDLMLIRWMLSLTPAERLDVLQQHLRSILRFRGEETDA